MSAGATKTVDMDEKFKCPTIVDKYNWSSDYADRTSNDTFSVTQSNGEAFVTRTDTSSGWGMNLKFQCCKSDTKKTTTYKAVTDLKHDHCGRPGEDNNSNFWWGDDEHNSSIRGYLVYGPYADNWGEGWGEATFRLKSELLGNDRHEVVLDIWDSTEKEVLAYWSLSRDSFEEKLSMQEFKLGFSTYGRKNNKMETRVWWKDDLDVWVGDVTVEMSPHSKGMVYEAERDLNKAGNVRGKLYTEWPWNDTNWDEGEVYPDAWGAKTGDFNAGYLASGPWATNWGEGSGKATFWLAVEENNNSDVIATLDIWDATDSRALKTRTIKRNEFPSEKAYRPFILNFTMSPGNGGHRMETRVYFKDNHHLWLDKVDVVITPK
jgi:hypothetical protein